MSCLASIFSPRFSFRIPVFVNFSDSVSPAVARVPLELRAADHTICLIAAVALVLHRPRFRRPARYRPKLPPLCPGAVSAGLGAIPAQGLSRPRRRIPVRCVWRSSHVFTPPARHASSQASGPSLPRPRRCSPSGCIAGRSPRQ